MQKMIPLSKQSKKKQREFYRKQRGSWFGVDPVTRMTANKKAYDRKRLKQHDIMCAGDRGNDPVSGFLYY